MILTVECQQSVNQYSFNKRHVKTMYDVQQSKRNIMIKTTKYLGLIWVFIQHACIKITVQTDARFFIQVGNTTTFEM